MTRFFFHLSDDGSGPDTDGHELAGLDAARKAAAQLVGQSLLDHPERFWESGDWVLTVTDETQLTLFTLRVYAIDAPAVQIEITAIPPSGS